MFTQKVRSTPLHSGSGTQLIHVIILDVASRHPGSFFIKKSDWLMKITNPKCPLIYYTEIQILSLDMFLANRFLCATRCVSHRFHRSLPRLTASNPADNAAIKSLKAPPTVVFNDYHVVEPPPTRKVVSKPLPKSVPKLIDVQTGLNQFLADCDERMLLMTIESK